MTGFQGPTPYSMAPDTGRQTPPVESESFTLQQFSATGRLATSN